MEVLKLRIKTNNKTELAAKTIKIYCILNDIEISKSSLEILSYFMTYGFNTRTKDLILRSKIFNNPTSIDNTLSKLRKLGLVVKVDVGLKTDTGRDDMCEGLRLQVKDSLGFIIKLENV